MDLKSLKLTWKRFDPEKDEVKVGSVIKLKNGNIELIGTLNEVLGSCDCCSRANRYPSSYDPGRSIEEIAYIDELLYPNCMKYSTTP